MQNSNSKKILLVDNDESALESMSTYLIDLGYDVFTARNCVTGLEMLKNLNPDVVISEIRMSGLSGIEFAIVIRGLNYHIPVILMSTRDKKKLSLADMCAYGYLQKPIDISEFRNMIVNAVSDGRIQFNELVDC